MDVNPTEMIEEKDAVESKSRLNAAVAIAVALLATFMGICKIKDDNICQAMQQAQADRIDSWSWYQARNIRQEVLEASASQIRAVAATQKDAGARASLEAEAKGFGTKAAEQAKKKGDTQKQANDAEKTYNDLNFRDDQFDMSDAALALAISLFALTALTQKKWLYGIALLPTAFGVIMGLAGLLQWGIHPDRIAGWLS